MFISSNSYSRPVIIKKDMDGQTIWKKYFDTGNDYMLDSMQVKLKMDTYMRLAKVHRQSEVKSLVSKTRH